MPEVSTKDIAKAMLAEFKEHGRAIGAFKSDGKRCMACGITFHGGEGDIMFGVPTVGQENLILRVATELGIPNADRYGGTEAVCIFNNTYSDEEVNAFLEQAIA